MLALEKSRQLAEQGFDTLLLCFNAPLANFLQQRAHKDVEVAYFHGLCKSLAKDAGIGFRAYNSEEEYYNKILPDMLLEAVLELGARYDAIVVDEGQDFQESWWDTLFHLLRDPEHGIFYVFFDSNQNIYHRQGALEQLVQTMPFSLTENCRNTISIHQVVREFHQDPDSLTCRGPAGRAPSISYFSSSHEQEEQVQKAIQYLVEEEKVAPDRIVLLTTRAPESAGFPPNKKLGNVKLIEWVDGARGRNEMRVSSVHRFKGLESGVVILTGLEDNDPDWINPILYVACSRARTHLIVIAHERSRDQISKIFHSK
jgi:superfamily I DNA/RNA helicase